MEERVVSAASELGRERGRTPRSLVVCEGEHLGKEHGTRWDRQEDPGRSPTVPLRITRKLQPGEEQLAVIAMPRCSMHLGPEATSLALKPRRKDVKNKVRSANHSWVFENTALIPFSPFSPVP